MTAPVTLFISDLHLDEARPAQTALFERFLAGRAAEADAVYILGDLFEAWIGDDDDAPLGRRAIAALARLAARVPVGVMHGNRDFLLGERFARETGVRLLAEPTLVELYGVPTLLSHGDALCTDDAKYQAFRTQVRDPAWQRTFLAQPLAARRGFAAQARAESARQNAEKAQYLMDVNADAVANLFRARGVDRLIHGHTHRPAIHDFTLDGRARRRIVLGDWYEQGSTLCVTPDGVSLETLPLA